MNKEWATVPKRTAAFLDPRYNLMDYLKASAPKRHKMRPDELYCLRCKCPRKPAFGDVDFTPDKQKSGLLTALCEECSTVTNKRISIHDLARIKPFLRISFSGS